ncbi:hypothetical protein ZHAS_00013637 [Anopheles sinensis]|uniref:Uncharacterized protein n=1 Tax=Anopheles sinensis TaxID=74873 RepID=A0A084W5Z9_ANOSI|nr:hypothetical protein ZHAS_00013637 [Anopheles sinensis]
MNASRDEHLQRSDLDEMNVKRSLIILMKLKPPPAGDSVYSAYDHNRLRWPASCEDIYWPRNNDGLAGARRHFVSRDLLKAKLDRQPANRSPIGLFPILDRKIGSRSNDS